MQKQFRWSHYNIWVGIVIWTKPLLISHKKYIKMFSSPYNEPKMTFWQLICIWNKYDLYPYFFKMYANYMTSNNIYTLFYTVFEISLFSIPRNYKIYSSPLELWVSEVFCVFNLKFRNNDYFKTFKYSIPWSFQES